MKKLHLICNAHLDPIWQWTWDEGISAVIATFKSAADLADEFDYVFCHNESLLYEAIEKNAPELFERIKKLVKEGKWHVTGGWYLQPDCLMPAGETFVRHIAVGKKYFKEKFGVEPTVTVNYDSFGHSLGLVQILAKNGYKGYLSCRPRNGDQFKYPGKFFKWISPDGSSILFSNSGSYSSPLGHAVEKITSQVTVGGAALDGKGVKSEERKDVDYVLWGVGNHGGGPSRKDLRDIAALKIENTEIIHSTPEALFDDTIEVAGEVRESLITCMPGCYSSMARIKQAYRKAENLFYATEKMISAASLTGLEFDTKAFDEAEKRLLLTTFHDILPGTCVEEGEREGLEMLASCSKTLKEYRTNAFLRMAMGQPCAGEGEFPVFVFNYMPYEVVTPVEVEFMLADQNWDEQIVYKPHIYMGDKEIPCQQIKEESTLNLDWRKRVVFEGKLAPLSLTRFTIKVEAIAPMEKPKMDGAGMARVLENNPLISKEAVFELYDDSADPWAMSGEELKAVGKNPVPFTLLSGSDAASVCGVKGELPAVRVIEEGNVYTAYESAYSAGRTSAILQYKIYKNQPFVDLKATVEYGDKNKLVRLKVPMPCGMEKSKVVGDGPFIWEQKPDSEVSFQKWLGLQGDNGEIFAVINDGVYAGKVEDGYLHFTLLRGAGYCMHPICERPLYPEDRYLPRIESGRYVYNFRLFRGDVSKVCRMAELFNQQPYAVNVFPTGSDTFENKAVEVLGEVVLATMRKRESGGYVFRIYNPAGEARAFSVKVGENSVQGKANAYEVVSVVYEKEKFEIWHESMPV